MDDTVACKVTGNFRKWWMNFAVCVGEGTIGECLENKMICEMKEVAVCDCSKSIS